MIIYCTFTRYYKSVTSRSYKFNEQMFGKPLDKNMCSVYDMAVMQSYEIVITCLNKLGNRGKMRIFRTAFCNTEQSYPHFIHTLSKLSTHLSTLLCG